MADHPVQLSLDDDLHRSRLTVFFRLLLAIPHIFWIVLWSIAVFFTAIAGWFAALFTGFLPEAIHGFLGRYVRYATHLGAYLSLAANPYPGFTGDPGYPVDITIPERQPQSRWTIGFRLFLALPALLLAAVLGSGFGGGGGSQGAGADDASNAQWFFSSGVGGVAAVCAILGWFAILATGRMPLGLRNLAAYGLGYTAQAYSYGLLLTDRYPNSDPEAIGPEWELPARPVRLELDDDRRRSRLTVFFRLLFAIPHFVWLLLWSIAAFLAAIANWFVVLVRGRSAHPLHRFLAAYVRYDAHVTAFVTLVANPFPGFAGTPGYPVDIAVDPPERQSRWKTLFRLFLSIPAAFVSGALTAVVVRRRAARLVRRARDRPDADRPPQPRGVCRPLPGAGTKRTGSSSPTCIPHASPALRPPPEPEPLPVFVPEAI